jgi:hypothetical protein
MTIAVSTPPTSAAPAMTRTHEDAIGQPPVQVLVQGAGHDGDE